MAQTVKFLGLNLYNMRAVGALWSNSNRQPVSAAHPRAATEHPNEVGAWQYQSVRQI
jgi:phosphoglycolate phosphatase-like HAD superfamily hydrolase